jgi:hypothetical protein
MNLVFSTAYDKSVYVNNYGKSQYIGVLGLLNILEREIGIFDIYPNNEDRINAYSKCLINNAKDSFYEDVITKDEANVGKTLLAYRDELIMLNWNYADKNQPTRLNDLSKVESDFIVSDNFVGMPDRWIKVLNTLDVKKVKEFGIKSIIVDDDIELLHPLLKEVFIKLDGILSNCVPKGIANNTNFGKIINLFEGSLKGESISSIIFNDLNKDDSLKIFKFRNKQLLEDSMAWYCKKDKNLVVNSDNLNFDYSLVSLGKTASGSIQTNSNPNSIQLIKLVTSCFSKNINVSNILSLLQLPKSPIDYILASKLAKQFSRTPGFGNDGWNKIINNYLEEPDIDDKEVKERKKIINLFLDFNYNIDEESSIKKAIKIYKYISKWTKKENTGKTPEMLEQYNYLSELSSNIVKAIEDETSLKNVLSKISALYQPRNFVNYYKQVDSIDVISDISNIATSCSKDTIWLDFYNKSLTANVGKFLLNEEVNFLKQNSWFYDSEKQVKLIQNQWLRGLRNIEGKLILCLTDGDIEKHPLMVRMESLTSEKEEVGNLINDIINIEDFKLISKEDITALTTKELPLPVEYMELDVLKSINPREKESASSIERFIEYPFDWVMQYIAKFDNNIGLELPNSNLLKGNIAHEVVENLFNKVIESNGDISIISETDFEEELNLVVKKNGAVFLQEEKRFELFEFKEKFRKSFNGLIDIIKQNNFEIIECEKAFGKDSDKVIDYALGKVQGSIDLLLKDEKGNNFIIDLKWTFSSKKFKEKLEKVDAVQLAIYTAAINDVDLSNTAYFILSENKLITSASIKGNNIEEVPVSYTNKDVLKRMKDSLEFRWQQIHQGKLEIGEDFVLTDLEYYDDDRISLPTNAKKKKVMPYTGYNLFKGTLK